MSGGGETTLRVSTEAKITGLLDYEKALKGVRREVQGLTRDMRDMRAAGAGSGSGGGGGGGGQSGSTPSGTAPDNAGGSQIGTDIGGNSGTSGVRKQPYQDQHGRWRAPGGAYTRDPNLPPSEGGGGRPSRAPLGMGQRGANYAAGRVAGGGTSFIKGAVGLGVAATIGGGLFSGITGAAGQYKQLSKVLMTVGRRFREAGDNAAYYGRNMGYTIGQSAIMAETLGSQTNTVNDRQFDRIAGMARATGMDTGTAMRGIGSMSRMSRRPVGDVNIASILGRAKRVGMDQGRLPEFMQLIQSTMQQQLMQTGEAGVQDALRTSLMSEQVLGASSFSKGTGQQLTQGMHQTMTQGGAMRTFMLRAKGYGRDPNMSLMDAEIAIAKGVHDPENVIDLFGMLGEQGMSKAGKERALMSVGQGKLTPQMVQSLVATLGTDEGLAKYTKASRSTDPTDMRNYMSTLSPEEQAAWKKSGMAGIGEKFVSAGERADLLDEDRSMLLGPASLEVMNDLKETGTNLAKAISKMFPELGKNLKEMSESLREMSGNVNGWMGTEQGGKFSAAVRQEGAGFLNPYESIGGRAIRNAWAGAEGVAGGAGSRAVDKLVAGNNQ